MIFTRTGRKMIVQELKARLNNYEKSYCLCCCMLYDAYQLLGFCSCGNYRAFDTVYTYSWAQIKLPDGTIIEGKVDNWTDYEGDQLQITIDGTLYLVHAANAIMKA